MSEISHSRAVIIFLLPSLMNANLKYLVCATSTWEMHCQATIGKLLFLATRYALLSLACVVGFFFPLGAFAVAQKHHGFPDLHLGLLVGFFLGLLSATNKRCKMLVLMGGCSGLVGIATFDPAVDFPGHGVHGLVYHGSCVAIAMAYFCGL